MSVTAYLIRNATECEARACRPGGVLVQFAVVARESGRLAFVITCAQSERAQLIASGEQFVLMACEGRDLTFGGRELLACVGP